ncbi:MAG: heme exporter protein CcmD [Pseudomonadota bacterium]
MMPDLGSYAVAVLSSYAVTFVLLAVLVGLSWRRFVLLRSELDALEDQRGKDA